MAKVSIRVHSDVEEYGGLLKDSLRLTAEATEGFCSYIHGDPDIMDEQYNKIVLAHAQFLGILAQIRYAYQFSANEEQDAELT
ncbi:MAG: hypothetical protein O3C11_12300 [Proteobacteria bacterium]|nr:hypothetical protein [Pseudomonadota bacterium]